MLNIVQTSTWNHPEWSWTTCLSPAKLTHNHHTNIRRDTQQRKWLTGWKAVNSNKNNQFLKSYCNKKILFHININKTWFSDTKLQKHFLGELRKCPPTFWSCLHSKYLRIFTLQTVIAEDPASLFFLFKFFVLRRVLKAVLHARI